LPLFSPVASPFLPKHYGSEAKDDHVAGHRFLFDDSDEQQRAEAYEETLPGK
jgi:hypothetical protein